MSLLDAALAYADEGWFVLPVRSGKHPGSIVGKGWPTKSSRDPEQIARWWRRHPSAGIALHVGLSGAVVFDLDKAEDLAVLPAELAAGLREGAFQRSRRNPASSRGHYVFATQPGEQFGNGAGAFRDYGDVRGRNGVILAAPTPHSKADTVGEYAWVGAEMVPALPDGLRSCLRAASVDEAQPLTPAELELFLDAHTAEDRPEALAGVLAKLDADLDAGISRHNAALEALCWGFREAVVGAYPARDAYAAVAEAFEGAFDLSDDSEGELREGRAAPGRGELAEAARWASAQAELADPEETLWRLHRDDPADDAGLDDRMARAVDRQAFQMEASQRARAQVSAANWTPPPRADDAFTVLARGVAPAGYVVEDLALVDSNLLLLAEAKAGKSTLLLNLVKAMALERPFLGRFAIDHLPPDSTITYLNFELSEAQAARWLGDVLAGVDRSECKHLPYLDPMTGFSMPLPSQVVEEEMVDRLLSRRSSVLILDPYGAAIDHDENDNSATRAWTQAIDRIRVRAGLKLVVIAAHTGTAAKDGGEPRVRGASRFTDWQSQRWALTHGGKPGDAPPDDFRYLRAFGRDVDVDELDLAYDRPTRTFSLTTQATGPGGAVALPSRLQRADRELDAMALKVYEAVAARAEEITAKPDEHLGPFNSRELAEAMGVLATSMSKPGGKGQLVRQARDLGVRYGWIVEFAGPRNSKLYTPGTNPREP